MVFLCITALLIGANWLLYVYAVNSGHILAGSLGYYLNPLANVLLGRIVLRERLSWRRSRNRGSCGRRPRPVVDQHHALPELCKLRAPAEDRSGRCYRRPGDRDGPPSALRGGLADLELRFGTAYLRKFHGRRDVARDRLVLYGEPFTTAHAIAFGAIWAALGLYVLAIVRHSRATVTIPE
jgi:hypothetical protein